MSNKKTAGIPADRQVPKLLLTYDEAAWSTGISKAKLYKLTSEGKIPVVRIGGNTLLRPQDLEQFAENNLMVKNQ